MDATHIHLVLTHFPIVGTFIGIGILAYGLYSKNEQINKVAFFIFILMAIITIPVYFTGEEAEETVEHIIGVSENLIEEHEDLAEVSIWLMGLLGVFAFGGFIASVQNLSFAKTISLLTLVISIATFGLFAQVGNLGGQIRHSEIRPEAAGFADDNGIKNEYRSHKDDDDDDDDDDHDDDHDDHHDDDDDDDDD